MKSSSPNLRRIFHLLFPLLLHTIPDTFVDQERLGELGRVLDHDVSGWHARALRPRLELSLLTKELLVLWGCLVRVLLPDAILSGLPLDVPALSFEPEDHVRLRKHHLAPTTTHASERIELSTQVLSGLCVDLGAASGRAQEVVLAGHGEIIEVIKPSPMAWIELGHHDRVVQLDHDASPLRELLVVHDTAPPNRDLCSFSNTCQTNIPSTTVPHQ